MGKKDTLVFASHVELKPPPRPSLKSWALAGNIVAVIKQMIKSLFMWLLSLVEMPIFDAKMVKIPFQLKGDMQTISDFIIC